MLANQKENDMRLENMKNFKVKNNQNGELEKSREFGKDITNALKDRSSFDAQRMGIPNSKQTKLIEFKNFVQSKQNKKNSTVSLITTKMERTKIIPFARKPLRKQTFNQPPKVSENYITNNVIQPSRHKSQSFNDTRMDIESQSVVFTETELNSKLTEKSGMEIDSNSRNFKNLDSRTLSFNMHNSMNNFNDLNIARNDLSSNDLQAFHLHSNEYEFLSTNEIPKMRNIQEVPDYIEDIFEYTKEQERSNVSAFYAAPNYMNNQYDINEKMRAILLDWLVDVHLKFKLLPETLFLTVNLIDRYLSKRSISRTKLQLVGVTAMLIACKYEEIYAPEVRDFVYITDKAYTNEEVKKLEIEMLEVLEFNVTVPSAFRFYEFYEHFVKYDELNSHFIRYLLELSLLDYKTLKHSGSILSAACVYVSTKLLHKEGLVFNNNLGNDIEKLIKLTGYSENQIKDVARDVCMIYDNSEKASLQAVRKKFMSSKFKEVSKIRFSN